MSKFVDILIDFLAYDAASSSNSPQDATKIKNELAETSVDELTRIQEIVVTAVTDQVIPVPNSSAEYLFIFTDQEISIKLNGSSDAITLTPQTAEEKAFVYYTRGTITALTLSNASGSSANIDIIMLNV